MSTISKCLSYVDKMFIVIIAFRAYLYNADIGFKCFLCGRIYFCCVFFVWGSSLFSVWMCSPSQKCPLIKG